jgi:hypothetical protein
MLAQESERKDSETDLSKGKEEIEIKGTKGMREETEDRAMVNLRDLIKGKTMVSEEAIIMTDQTINPITTKEKEEERINTMISRITLAEEARKRLNHVTKELTRSQ